MKKIALLFISMLAVAVPASADFVICADGICIGDGRIAPDRRHRSPDIVTCQSRDGRYNECHFDSFRSRGVRIVEQHSRTACRYGRNWGYSWNRVWVDGGCRATFRVVRY
jgi:hypothetical protein